MQDKLFLYIGLAVINIPTFLIIAKILFKDVDEFKTGLSDSHDTLANVGAKLKMGYLTCLCVAIVIGEAVLLTKHFPKVAAMIHGCTLWIFNIFI